MFPPWLNGLWRIPTLTYQFASRSASFFPPGAWNSAPTKDTPGPSSVTRLENTQSLWSNLPTGLKGAQLGPVTDMSGFKN